jgi:23S rRNA pseudouridine2604 synthase
MCTSLGFEVVRLKRIRIMKLTLGSLKPGQYREVTPEEIGISEV